MTCVMAEHPNVQKIRDTYDAFGAGDLSAALKDLAPAGVLHFRGSGPLSGERMGVENIKKVLVDAYVMTAGTRHFDITNIYADDHHAVVMLHETASRPDGATLDVDEVHVIAFDDEGRITDLWDLPSDPEAHIRFFDGA
jgi:ketosteroid isomerase-like protein